MTTGVQRRADTVVGAALRATTLRLAHVVLLHGRHPRWPNICASCCQPYPCATWRMASGVDTP